mmetsp:Transcript_5251/g.18413  ORF Transcript_5251/g.18413 Transcript_5251/m.18413 type:complete len:263 (+) Transcript_5251:106-894(+)
MAEEVSYHRRQLPEETCVSFSSAQGVIIFKRALRANTMGPYFALAEQFTTQAEPAYCGLATLVMVLNAMAIDPKRVWKGVWRWFSEELLSCCKDIEEVKKEGISLAEFARLARCNGAACDVVSGEDSAVDEFREAVLANATGRHGDRGGPCCEYICCNYDRRALGQTGQGHFSPIAGYDEVEDLVLVLDVARFKYPPHWVRLADLHLAMAERGYALVSPGVDAVGGGGPALGCEGGCLLEGYDREGRSLGGHHKKSCARCGR